MPEDLLRKYRPAGPDARLRERVVGLASADGRAWPWAVAAAALLALTIGLHVATRSAAVRAMDEPVEPSGFENRVLHLTAAMGGGEDAHRFAVLIATGEEMNARLARVAGTPQPENGP